MFNIRKIVGICQGQIDNGCVVQNDRIEAISPCFNNGSVFFCKETIPIVLKLKGSTKTSSLCHRFCFCECRTVSYSASCVEQVAEFPQGMLVVVLPLKGHSSLDIKTMLLTNISIIGGNVQIYFKITQDRQEGQVEGVNERSGAREDFVP